MVCRHSEHDCGKMQESLEMRAIEGPECCEEILKNPSWGSEDQHLAPQMTAKSGLPRFQRGARVPLRAGLWDIVEF